MEIKWSSMSGLIRRSRWPDRQPRRPPRKDRASTMSSIPKTPSLRGFVLGALVVVLLVGLPIAVWLDLRDVSNLALRRQASDVNSLVTGVRGYYASNVVARVQAATGPAAVVHNYRNIPGAIPVPATLSLELGRVIYEEQHNIL